MIKKLGLILALFGFIAISNSRTFAATAPLSLEASPLPILVNTVPGQPVVTSLKIKNTGNQTEKLSVSLLKVSQDSNGVVSFKLPDDIDPSTKWVTFSDNVLTVDKDQTSTVKMTLSPPASAAFGYYYAVEFSRYEGVIPEPGKTVAGGALAQFVLLNVDVPGAKREAKIEYFKTTKSTYEFLPVQFNVKVKSTGNVHVAPHGNIFIYKNKKQIAQLDVNKYQSNILPGAGVIYTQSWEDGFPRYEKKYNDQLITDSSGNPAYTLKWNFSDANKIRFGKYTAKLVLIYDDGKSDIPIESTISFWIIPWRIIGAMLLVLVLLAFGAWSIYKKSKKFINKTKTKLKNSDQPKTN